MNLKKKLNYFFFLLFFTIFLLFVAEIIIRKIYGYNLNNKNFISEKSLLESNEAVDYDELLSWNHKKNLQSPRGLNTDENGFRISRKFKNIISNDKQIFVSGASFAAGAEVEDHQTWPFYLEKSLGSQIINSAVGGWDSFQIIQNVLKNYKFVKPNLVIIQFTDAIERSKYKVYSSAYKSRYDIIDNSITLKNYPVKKFIKSNYLTSNDSTLVDQLVNMKIIRAVFNNSFFLYKLQKKIFNSPYGLNFDKVYTKDEKNIFQKNCLLINFLKKKLDEKNIHLLAIIQHRGDLILRNLNSSQPPNEKKLEKCLVQSNIEVLNFWKILQNYYLTNGEDEFKKLYKIKDNKYFGHMSKYGNFFVANKIKEMIDNSGI